MATVINISGKVSTDIFQDQPIVIENELAKNKLSNFDIVADEDTLKVVDNWMGTTHEFQSAYPNKYSTDELVDLCKTIKENRQY